LTVQGLCKENLKFALKQTKELYRLSIENDRLPRALTSAGDMHWCRSRWSLQ
jgi:hypothetical protein